jgi:hypothetical protein
MWRRVDLVRTHIPEDSVLHSHRCENLKFYKAETSLKWSGHEYLSAGDHIKPDTYRYFKGFYFIVCNTNFHFFNIMTLH